MFEKVTTSAVLLIVASLAGCASLRGPSVEVSFRSSDGVELVGTLGFASTPLAVKTACLDMAREMHRQGPGGAATQLGVSALGVPIFMTGAPPSFKALVSQGSPYVRRTYLSI